MPWSMVSNAALRSNNRSTEVELESGVRKKSLAPMTHDYAGCLLTQALFSYDGNSTLLFFPLSPEI